MFCLNSLVDDVINCRLPSESQIKEKVEKSINEVDLVVEHDNDMNMIKIINIDGIKEKKILKYFEIQSLLLAHCSYLTYPTEIIIFDDNAMIIERNFYSRDFEEIIHSNCFTSSDICRLICSLCDILMILSEYELMVSNLKSSNIIYESDDEKKICDLCLNELRKEEDLRIYDICFKSPEELNGLEFSERSVIWSIGCILYEMIYKKLPFNEDDSMMKTMNNVLRCKYSLDIECDDNMKEIICRILKVNSEDRLGLKELKKEIIKMSEIKMSNDGFLMIIENRIEILSSLDEKIWRYPLLLPVDYYINSRSSDKLINFLIYKYSQKENEKILSVLLMLKLKNRDGVVLYKYIDEYYNECIIKDKPIKEKLEYHILHQCKDRKECFLDEMILNIDFDKDDEETIKVNSECFCFCKEGLCYFFRTITPINPKKLKLKYINIPLQFQLLIGSLFSHLAQLEELSLSGCSLSFHFIESFVKSIPLMKLKYVDLSSNLIGSIGFKSLLPYLHLLINKDNELNLNGMNLNNESMILLSEELYKHPNIMRIDIKSNKNIHSKGLKALFSKYPISNIKFDFNGSIELLIDEDVPRLIEYIKYYNKLNLSNCEVDDDIFKSFISLRWNELRNIERLYLRYNKLTYKSIEILMYNLNLLPSLKEVQLNGNEIGDEGMKLLSPYLHLLKDYENSIYCWGMGLSSSGLKHLLDGLKNIKKKVQLHISSNDINSDVIYYLIKYVKENDNISSLFLYNNPIGNIGFKLLLKNINLLNYQGEMNLSNISIDDKSVILLADKIDSIRGCRIMNLNGNNISSKGLIIICSKSLEKEEYPFIEINNPLWRNEELEYYLDYCVKKKTRYECDFSNMNINDSYITLIKQINYSKLDLSDNYISYDGLKELTDSLPKNVEFIEIYNNEIGNEGIELICKYLDKFVDDYNSSLNLSDIGMSEKGLKILSERLKDYKPLRYLYLIGNEFNESELRFMIKNQEVFDCLDALSISVKEDIDKSELKTFLNTFSTIRLIHFDGICQEELDGILEE